MSSIMYSQRAGKPRTYLSEVCEASPCKTGFWAGIGLQTLHTGKTLEQRGHKRCYSNSLGELLYFPNAISYNFKVYCFIAMHAFNKKELS